MNVLHRKVRNAQRQLWLNRWLSNLGWCLLVAGVVFMIVTLTRRIMGLEVAVVDGWIAIGLGAGALVVSAVWTLARRESAYAAAARLDEAAGLKERISTGLYCVDDPDPFAQAVHQQAQHVAGSLTVRQHLRLRYPRSITFAGAALLAAVLVFWLVQPFATQAAQQRLVDLERQQRIERTRARVKKQLDKQVEKLAETNPDLKKLPEFESLGQMPTGQVKVPGDIIRDKLKKMEKLTDTLKQKRGREAIAGMSAFKKMLRQLKPPNSGNDATRKLSKALAEGDFKIAQEAIKELREQLAKLGGEKDKEKAKALQKQLNNLGEQLAKMAEQKKKLAEKMKKAGLTPEQAKRMLEDLSKKDMEKIKKELAKTGMKPEQIEKLARQMKKQQTASKMAGNMGSAMKQAAGALGDMQIGESMDGLQQAGDQLSELEMLEEEMKQLDSTLAQISQMKDSMGQQCQQCQGTGMVGDGPCPACQGAGMRQGGMRQGQGGGMGKLGRGQGGIAQSKETRVSFKKEREKVKTQRGRIIGQILVDGKQVAGESSSEYREALTAAQREASDAVSEDRIPRKFQESVKKYHSTLTFDAGMKKNESNANESTDNGTKTP